MVMKIASWPPLFIGRLTLDIWNMPPSGVAPPPHELIADREGLRYVGSACGVECSA
jgi:hypothetical protein